LIFSTTLIAQSISPAWKRDPAEGERRVARLLELSQAALKEMRALLFEMRPPVDLPPGTPTWAESAGSIPAAPLAALELVRRIGLVEALRKLAAGLEGDGLKVIVESPAGKEPGVQTSRLPAQHEEALYRIAQESLHNIIKHAGARNVTVRI
jgi:signal transduction histidine kinase